MKVLKYIPAFIIVSAFLFACAASKQGKPMRKNINGNWSLQTINTEGINSKFEAKIFDEADMNCFIGSSWEFTSADSTGSYTLTGGTKGCSTLQRNIRWSLFEPNDATKEFQFKRLDAKNNSIDDSSGFRLNVTILNNNTMQLKSAITFEGKPGNIVYNFVKK